MGSAPVLIVGAGVAGLTAARCLARRQQPFRVLERQTPGLAFDRGLGIWGRSQVALRKLGLAYLLDCPERVARIPAAAYRSHDGQWLSQCTDTPHNRQRVCTLRQSDLLTALEAELPDGSVQRGVDVVAVTQHSTGVKLSLKDGTSMDGVAVLGADGVNSTVRRLAFPGDMAPLDMGYVSNGGLLLPPSPGALDALFAAGDGSRYAFETLAAGRRFAAVPLASGGCFWFATRPMAANTADGEGSNAAGLGALRDAYADWHEPIPRILHAAACATAEAAMTHGKDGEHGQTGSGSMAAAAAFRSERVMMAPRLEQWWEGRVVLVGDAAHALPINLAQGASAAIEGAYLLGNLLGESSAVGEWSSSSFGSSDADATYGDHAAEPLARAFAAYQAAHEPRVRQCRLATLFTAALALPASSPTEQLRNAMRFVPQPCVPASSHSSAPLMQCPRGPCHASPRHHPPSQPTPLHTTPSQSTATSSIWRSSSL